MDVDRIEMSQLELDRPMVISQVLKGKRKLPETSRLLGLRAL